MTGRPFLLDVSRLVWRVWQGRRPTGVDRVCLAYLDRFADRSQAVLQRGDRRVVLSPRLSDALFALLKRGGRRFRIAFPAILTAGIISAERRDLAGRIYLNVGHTGLDAAGLPAWTARTGVKPVYLVHDLIPIIHPRFGRAGEAARHARRMRHALASAAGIIANSAATLADIEAFAAAQNLAMPPAIAALLGADMPAAAVRAVPVRTRFVCIGTIEVRKNHLLLLRVWQRLIAKLGAQAPELILIGQRGWEADDVFALLDGDANLRSHVRELGRCDDGEMLALLAGARALLMPSLAEGYGIPVVEALQQGTPVLAADLPVYRELAGDIPEYLDPQDVGAWEAAVLTFMEDGPRRDRQLAAFPHWQPPGWAAHFAQVEEFLAGL